MSNVDAKTSNKTGRKLFAGLIILVGLGLAAWLILAPADEKLNGERDTPPPPVLVETVRSETMPMELQSLGTVRANEQATLSSVVTEQVTEVHYEDGQTVKKGDLLMQLDDAEQQALLIEAESLLAERERQVERVKQVEGTGALSKSLIDEELSKLTRARAGVDLIKAAINDRRVTAPFDGIVGLRDVSVGELITPGKTLAIISDLDPIKVDFTAPEQYIGHLAPGQTVEAFSVAWPERTFEGEIVSLSPIVNPVTRAAQIRAIINNDDLALRPGMLLEIKINLGQAEALTVKESALIPLGEKQFAFQVVDGIAERKEVSIGRRFPGKVEITSGLSEGDVVITEGFRAIPGMPVNVTQPEDVYTVGQEGS